MVGGGGWSLDCQYYIWILPHAYLVCPAVSSASIFAPVLLTLHILSSCSSAWKHLDAIKGPWCSTDGLRLRSVLWYERLQVSYEIHLDLACALSLGLLTSFQRSPKVASYSGTVPLLEATMGQESLSLQYLIFLHSPHPLRSSSIIQWSIDTSDSLMQIL